MNYAMIAVLKVALSLPESDRHVLRVIDLEAEASRFTHMRRADVAADLVRIARERRVGAI